MKFEVHHWTFGYNTRLSDTTLDIRIYSRGMYQRGLDIQVYEGRGGEGLFERRFMFQRRKGCIREGMDVSEERDWDVSTRRE